MNGRANKWRKRAAAGLILLALLAFFSYTQNNWLSVTGLTIRSERLPESFRGFTVAQLSDLHSKRFGKDQRRLVRTVVRADPDIVVITGDLIDSSRYDEEPALTLVRELAGRYPVYYVTGNHEANSGKFDGLEEKLKASGVTVLRQEHIRLDREGESIYLLGIDDPAFGLPEGGSDYTDAAWTERRIEEAGAGLKDDDFTVLLAHRPEQLPVYARSGMDVVFSGHAHGGQVRIPFTGGLVAPNQGWLPAYTEGVYPEGRTNMIVSRGLGNSIIPQRIFNRPEVVIARLE